MGDVVGRVVGIGPAFAEAPPRTTPILVVPRPRRRVTRARANAVGLAGHGGGTETGADTARQGRRAFRPDTAGRLLPRPVGVRLVAVDAGADPAGHVGGLAGHETPVMRAVVVDEGGKPAT